VDSDQQIWLKARKRAEEKAGFFVHLGIYLAVNTFLGILWWTTTGPFSYPWFVIPMAGWGIGVVGHFVSVLAGESYIDRTAQREYARLRGQGP